MTFIRFIRNMEGSKHFLRVSVKWLLRLCGIILIFNSTASPMLSLGALGILAVLYFGHLVSKSIRGRSDARGAKNKKDH